MNKVEATKLAKRVGMTKIYGTFHSCIIGFVPGFKGFSICNNTRGCFASGFVSFRHAIDYLNGIIKIKK